MNIHISTCSLQLEAQYNNMEFDEAIMTPALFHPMVKPNWKQDGNKPLKDRCKPIINELFI